MHIHREKFHLSLDNAHQFINKAFYEIPPALQLHLYSVAQREIKNNNKWISMTDVFKEKKVLIKKKIRNPTSPVQGMF